MSQSQFVCQQCGTPFPRWQGKCTDCGAWNSLVEETTLKIKAPVAGGHKKKAAAAPIPIDDIPQLEEERISTHLEEFDRVLGEGLVKGAAVLLGGEPGIGKSTLSLQVAQQLAARGHKVLYITGEESASQIQLRSRRLGTNTPNLLVYAEVNILNIAKTIVKERPDVFILDSIQVVFHPDIPSIAGSINQVRQCAVELIQLVKEHHLIGLFIGHVTKEGGIAGPKVLEHLVDVILYFEGERNHRFRLLRCFKNRYASTQEVGIFEMKESGLVGVSNPSELFVDESTLTNPGSMVAAVSEGSRVILVELQALVVASGYGMAKRTFLGVDANRANLMIAAMEKILNLPLSSKDIILNIVGGLKITEPALDLPMVLAIISSLHDKPISKKIGLVGEVGLTGEIRAVPNLQKRLIEFEKMGFEAAMIPQKNQDSGLKTTLTCIPVNTLQDAIRWFLTH
ncbi:MAG: DNA repair protein RadA [Candidatus Margulisiibacteriota bacterium]